jgi:hypothetical protein
MHNKAHEHFSLRKGIEMKKRQIAILVLVGLLLGAVEIQATPITIQISGTITSASGDMLPATINAGDTFTGSYTYESSTPDSGGGHYVHDTPYGISLSLGGYTFMTTPGHTDSFDMRIADDLVTNGTKDFYSVRSEFSNVSTPSLGFNIDSIRWDLWDTTHTALSSGDMPIVAPILAAWDLNELSITNYVGGGLFIKGTVTQAIVIPEPLTAVLMAMGSLFLKHA